MGNRLGQHAVASGKALLGPGVDVRLDFLQCGGVWRGYRYNEHLK